MTDSTDNHAPTPEFGDFLARDIVRTLRHDARFAPSPGTLRARRVGLIAASAAGTVVVLAVGLVLGTSTGYASARVESDRQRDEMAVNTMGVTSQLAVLRLDLERARADLTQREAASGAAARPALQAAAAELRAMAASVERIELDLAQNRSTASSSPPTPALRTPVKRALAATCSALALCADSTPAQQSIPTITLPAASARTTEPMWNVAGIRQVAGGKVLVNDMGSRQLRLFDSALTTSTVAMDSTAYGARRPRPFQLSAYLGDSSLFPDPPSQTIRVLDGNGQVARTVSVANVRVNLAGPGYADDKGRLLYSGIVEWATRSGDSLPIVRIDVASGRVDTVARIKNSDRSGAGFQPKNPAAVSIAWLAPQHMQSLVPGRDDWAVLSDGSIAMVRGHDYHIDWIHPDGTMTSAPKLPFDWQRLAEESKKQVDAASRGATYGEKRAARADSAIMLVLGAKLNKLYVANLNLLHDFALRVPGAGSVIPDLDGNLWVLPTMSAAEPPNDTLIYDVISRNGQLFQRVRVPAGRSITGFGKGGVVYLVSGNRNDGFYLERTKLAVAPK